jgi:DNA-binding CsgD family transcriptional regulator
MDMENTAARWLDTDRVRCDVPQPVEDLPAQARQLELRGEGCIVVDQRQHVAYLAPRARVYLADGGLTITADNRLTTEDPRQAAMLRHSLDIAFDPDPGLPPAIALVRSRQTTPLVVTFASIAERATPETRRFAQASFPSVRAAFVLLRDPSCLDDERLAHAFGLTPREVQLCCHLARGGRVSQFATLHSLSAETVKSHLKSVFRKVGVHNQVELVICLLAVLR